MLTIEGARVGSSLARVGATVGSSLARVGARVGASVGVPSVIGDLVGGASDGDNVGAYLITHIISLKYITKSLRYQKL